MAADFPKRSITPPIPRSPRSPRSPRRRTVRRCRPPPSPSHHHYFLSLFPTGGLPLFIGEKSDGRGSAQRKRNWPAPGMDNAALRPITPSLDGDQPSYMMVDGTILFLVVQKKMTDNLVLKHHSLLTARRACAFHNVDKTFRPQCLPRHNPLERESTRECVHPPGDRW